MDYLYYSAILFNIATFGYLVATLFLILNLVSKKIIWLKLFQVLAIVVVAFHNFALLLRWLHAGFDRPPWTNLYESLIFFTWGLGLVSTVVIFRYKSDFLATFLYPLAFAGLGLAAMVPDKSITPLVPSLQSYWIKIHVVMASMAYPGFVTAGVISLAYLLKSKTSLAKLSIGFAIVTLFSLVIVGGGDVFLHGSFHVAQTVFEQGRYMKIPIDPQATPVQFVMTEIHYAGTLFLLTAGAYLFSIFYSLGAVKDAQNSLWITMNRWLNGAGLVLFASLMISIYWQMAMRDDISLGSNQYSMAILWIAFCLNVFFVIYTELREAIDTRLPTVEWLDEFAYKVTLFAFPFMTLLLITGAIWAYSAWGRYWGWDPKETCALMTWLIFAAYLHSRRYFNTMGRPAAVISIIGAISVFFTFLGANLVLSGLHSYGAQ